MHIGQQGLISAIICALAWTVPGHACLRDSAPASIPLYSLLAEQIALDAHASDQRDLPIGSLLNLAVPKGAKVTLTSLAKGSMEPLAWLDDAAYARIDRSRLDEREVLPTSIRLDGQEIRHLIVNSYGKARIDIHANGAVRHLVIGAIYEAPVPHGRPIPLAESGKAALPSFNRSMRDAGLWLKVPGKVADGWQLRQARDNDFSILRIEQLEVPYDDPPAVGIFVHGSSSMKSGELALVSGGLFFGKTYPFKVQVMPVPAC
ncbi:MAG TPA: hypothetical protein VFW93_12595 [Aquabacterium sp.]|uniref:hypothetical protein n=1 Tax=Aquabacterium sp. TaxID=1872578 RepID=UPI002E2F69C1|nr:hypothetical protein [Aquabacterium sp.]HEX5357054.1 hypothetical protein [Aquabacterium sp.]